MDNNTSAVIIIVVCLTYLAYKHWLDNKDD